MTLENFKKSNKVRREAIAKKAGMSVDEYIKSLSNICETKKSLIKEIDRVISTKKVIHNVVLLDSSGSMRGSKYDNSINGIIAELESVKSNNETTIYHHLYDFLNHTNKVLVERYSLQTSPKFNFLELQPTGKSTPLYTSLLTLLSKLSDIPESEKVLVKVYTDGENNDTRDKRIPCAELIKSLSKKNFTITFVATENDMRSIVIDLQLDNSNTLRVHNTGEGFKEAFSKSLIATKSYINKVENNEEVSSGFYKSVGKL